MALGGDVEFGKKWNWKDVFHPLVMQEAMRFHVRRSPFTLQPPLRMPSRPLGSRRRA